MILQTYQFERPDRKATNRTNRNSLAYTEMCKGDALPKPGIFDSSNGNFITDDMPWQMKSDFSIYDANVLGSTCLSSEILFQSHFVPRLKPIVKMTQVSLLSCHTDAGANNEYQWDLGFDGDRSKPNSDDDYYTMKRMTGHDAIYHEKTWFGAKGDSSGNNENKWGYRWVMETSHLEAQKSAKILKDTTMSLDGTVALNMSLIYQSF